MTRQQEEIRKKRDEALAIADRKYRWALETATEMMQEARQIYNKEAFTIQETWRKDIAELD